MIRTALVFTLLLFAISSFAEETHKDASYLIEGVEKIYLVDESRCSSPANKDDAGKVYLIEGTEKISKIQGALKKMTDMDSIGGCLCGGADKIYYCFKGKKLVRSWGLDCDTFLNSHQVTQEVNSLINPNLTGFLGVQIGYGYLASLPLEISDELIVRKASEKGILTLCRGSERDYAIKNKNKKDNTKYLEALLQIKQIKDFQPITDEDTLYNHAANLEELVGGWMAKSHEMPKFFFGESDDSESRFMSADPSSSPFDVKIYLYYHEPINIKADQEVRIGSYNIAVKKTSWKNGAEILTQYHYDLIVVGNTSDVNSERMKIMKALPEVKNVRCICDRYGLKILD